MTLEHEMAAQFCKRPGTLYFEQYPHSYNQNQDGELVIPTGPSFSVKILEAEVLALLRDHRDKVLAEIRTPNEN